MCLARYRVKYLPKLLNTLFLQRKDELKDAATSEADNKDQGDRGVDAWMRGDRRSTKGIAFLYSGLQGYTFRKTRNRMFRGTVPCTE